MQMILSHGQAFQLGTDLYIEQANISSGESAHWLLFRSNIL